MAKKKNVYTQLSYDRIRENLDSIVEWLDSQIIEAYKDDVDYKANQRGGISPQIIAKVEEKIKVCVKTIKSAAKMLNSILDKEGVDTYLAANVERLQKKLQEIQEYYDRRPIASFEHRRIEYTTGGNKGRTTTFIVATQYQQIADRTMINEWILETLPDIKKLEDKVEAVNIKGDMDIPISLRMRGLL